MTPEDARKFAFALDGLIRARTKGHGGEVYARKCVNEMAEALTDKPTTVTALLLEERGVDTSCQPLTGDGSRLKDAIRNEPPWPLPAVVDPCKNCGHAKMQHFPWCSDPYVPGKCNYQYDLCSCRNYEPV